MCYDWLNKDGEIQEPGKIELPASDEITGS